MIVVTNKQGGVMTIDEALALLHLEPEATYTPRDIAMRLGYETRHTVYIAARTGRLETVKPDVKKYGLKVTGAAAAAWAVQTGRIELIKRVREQAAA
jgi:hypothetical protein